MFNPAFYIFQFQVRACNSVVVLCCCIHVYYLIFVYFFVIKFRLLVSFEQIIPKCSILPEINIRVYFFFYMYIQFQMDVLWSRHSQRNNTQIVTGRRGTPYYKWPGIVGVRYICRYDICIQWKQMIVEVVQYPWNVRNKVTIIW